MAGGCWPLKVACVLCWLGLPLLGCKSKLVIRPDSLEDAARHSNWNFLGGDPQRTHSVPNTVRPPLQNLWTHRASSAPGKALLVVDGVLYFATLDGRVAAVDVHTGKKLGGFKAPRVVEAGCAYDQSSLILASRYGKDTLSRYDLSTGDYLWKVPAGHIATEPLILGDAVYVTAIYNHADKYDLRDGRRLWSFRTEDQLHSSPALGPGVLVFGSDDGTVYALNPDNGELRWTFEAGGSVFATPTICGETVFLGALDSVFYALDLETGALKWRHKAERPIFQGAACNGRVVIWGTSGGTLFCLDAATGEEKWRFWASGSVSTPPLIAGDVVYFGSLDRLYYGLELASGKELWRFRTRGRVRTAPVVWGTYLFGASEDRYIYAFTPADSTVAVDSGS